MFEKKQTKKKTAKCSLKSALSSRQCTVSQVALTDSITRLTLQIASAQALFSRYGPQWTTGSADLKVYSRERFVSNEVVIGLGVRVFANGPGDLGSIPARVIPKNQKMVLDASLLSTQHYKVQIKGKVEQSR